MIYFVSYPKCGRTWCRVIVDEYAKRSKKNAKDHHWTHMGFGNYAHKTKDPIEKAKGWLEEDAKRVLLVRNNMDTLVSYYHDQTKSFSNIKRQYRKKTINDYVLDKADNLLKFKEKSRELSYEYEFSYEQMSEDPFNTFLPVMKMLFDKVDEDIFKEVIEFCHFDNLHKLERKGKVNMRSGPTFRKTRKGKVGSHKEELDPETIKKLKKKLKNK